MKNKNKNGSGRIRTTLSCCSESISGLKKPMLLLLLVLGIYFSKAQTITFNLVKAPCNHDGILVATVSGMTGPYRFQWYGGQNNETHSGIVATSDTLKNYAGGDINLWVSGSPGNLSNVYKSALPFTFSYTTVNANCPIPGSVALTIIGGQSPYSVNWYQGATTNVVATGQNPTLPGGNYRFEVTDAAGCMFGNGNSYGKGTLDSLVYIDDSNKLGVTTSVTPANCTNGTASVSNVTGAVPPNSYLWSNGQTSQQINNLTMGYYAVTVTDSKGCTGVSNYVYVSQSVKVNANVVPTAATCIQNNGSAISFGSGGMPPYTYAYSDGQNTQTASNLSAGYYNVTVTDANGCIGNGYFNITASTPITVTYAATASSCTAPTGTVNLLIAGGTPVYTVNWATSPVQSGPLAQNLMAGVYYFKVTDSQGCVRDGQAIVPTISGLAGYEYSSAATCPNNNGTAGVVVTSGAAPFTYSWNTGATTPSITNVASNGYTCKITDSKNCVINKSVLVKENSTISLSFSSTDATCIFNSDGAIAMNIVGGIPPYTISWSNGQQTQNASGLRTGEYSVYVVDSKGCKQFQRYIYVGYNSANTTCYCTLNGSVYHDVNANCVKDPGEKGIENIMINTGGFGYTFTNANGDYSKIVPSGNYTVQEIVNNFYPLAACENNNRPVVAIAAAGCVITNDFANVINPLHDIHIYTIHWNQPVPGNVYTDRVVVRNDGTIAENGIQMAYTHDGQLSYSGSTGVTFAQPNAGSYPNWYAVNSGFPALNPAQNTVIDVNYNVATNIPLGTVVNVFDTVVYTGPMSNWLTDYSPWNNLNHRQTVVVGSFDPNFKEVIPQGTGPLGYISPNDTVFDYIVHFQNTGTAPAQKVVIKDQLDSDFNLKTLRPGYATHAYRTELNDAGEISFIFDNINLPDSATSQKGSMGLVTYSIHAKKNLPLGTQFKNEAAIYFDYNAPVITNTTVNTTYVATGVAESKSADNVISLFPNPATDVYTVKVMSAENTNDAKIAMYSIDGRVVFEKQVTLDKGTNTFSYSTADVAPGLYIIKVTGESGQHLAKLSVTK